MSAKVLRPLLKLNQEPALPRALVNRGCRSTQCSVKWMGIGQEAESRRESAPGRWEQGCRRAGLTRHGGTARGVRRRGSESASPTLDAHSPPSLPHLYRLRGRWGRGTSGVRSLNLGALGRGSPGGSPRLPPWAWEVNPETVPLTPGAPSGSGGAGLCSPATARLPVSGSTGFLRNRLPCVLGSGSALKNAVPREV